MKFEVLKNLFYPFSDYGFIVKVLTVVLNVCTSEESSGELGPGPVPSVRFLPVVPLVTIKSVETVIKALQHILMPRLGPHPSQPGTPDHITTLGLKRTSW